jgi:hypothetical protein
MPLGRDGGEHRGGERDELLHHEAFRSTLGQLSKPVRFAVDERK